MYNNGVSHAVVPDDFEGIVKVLHWLSYVPLVSFRFFFLVEPKKPADILSTPPPPPKQGEMVDKSATCFCFFFLN